MNAFIQLPKYKCHKEVWALKIREVVFHADADPKVSIETFAATDEFKGGHMIPEDGRYGPIPFEPEYYHKHKPEAGGYFVVYEDGYKSFSPAKAFEDGYTPID
jgi:hypothetical protein